MSQNERVMNLFRFMMDLLEEENTTNVSETNEVEETKNDEEVSVEVKKLTNPMMPYHPIFNPYLVETPKDSGKQAALDNMLKSKQSPFEDPNSLFSKMAEIDKRRAKELGETRAVRQDVRPLIQELEALRRQGHDNARKAKETEELELLSPELETRMGVTIENGKTKVVEVPSQLRDNIPLNEGDNVIGHSMTKVDEEVSNEMKGINDLPKEIRDKLNTESDGDAYLKDSKMPQAIKDAMLNATKKINTDPTENNLNENKE